MFPQLDITDVRTQSVSQRTNKVNLSLCARPFDATTGSFAEFAATLPDVLKVQDLRLLARTIVEARRRGLPVILMMGAHVIKTGLAPLVCHLMRTGVVSATAMNSAGAIHDSESALFGVTSEDVALNLLDGSFGMWKETGDFLNGALTAAYSSGNAGFGEVIGEALIAAKAPHLEYSILATGVETGVPVTVHAAIGTDIVHQQPSMNGAATGELSFRDFKVLANVVKELRGGGVVLNVGSAVILPEVFLKCLTVVRNLGYEARGFTTANFDMIQHYRPTMNVVSRPTQDGGAGLTFTGHHEIMVPLLAALIGLAQAGED